MATVFENIGFNIEDEDGAYRLADFVLNSGSILPTENGAYACWSDRSGAEIWERLALDHETKSVSLLNIDPHFNGSTVWRLELSREFSAERDDMLDFKALLKKPDSEQSLCARVMGAYAISDFTANAEYDFQVSMIPHSIAFFENELEMRKTLSDDTTALGALAPVGMYMRMLSAEDEVPTDILMTRVCAEIVTGDVRFMIADKTPVGEFLHLVLNTQFGELDIAVSQNQYETKNLPKLCEGGMVAVVNGIISAKLIKREKASAND
ncbi:MAG: hypothetical protein IJE70_06835 [Oscillospiraceae bacterium]|nr:hypothetical protein [Oscillospiraceae bacterium]MBQ6902217.1 hypothetical protein [Oscillospiraceae bacterium]